MSCTQGLEFLVKRLTSWESWEKAKAEVVREFETLSALRIHQAAELGHSVPRPLGVDPEHATIIVEKLPGQNLHVLLRRYSHLLSPRRVHSILTHVVHASVESVLLAGSPLDSGLDPGRRNIY